MKTNVCLALVLAAAAAAAPWPVVAAAGTATATASQRAGTAAAAKTIDSIVAEKWLPAGRGYDWSHAGYAEGKRPIPDKLSLTLFNVKQFGAKGDGKALDDVPVQRALRRALAARGGIVFFPRGNYALSKPLYANASNIVLRGAGRDLTRIVFTQSLSDVYTQWGVDACTGGPTALWSAGGAMIFFNGLNKKKPERVAKVRSLRHPVAVGDRRLVLTSTAGIKVGDQLMLVVDDNSTANLPAAECDYRNDLYNNITNGTAGGASASAAPAWRPQPVPAQLVNDPILDAAIAAKLADSESEPVTAAQAAALDWSHAIETGRADASMAKRGTIAAWVYGNNKADSGGPGAINTGAVRLVFRVTAVGNGFIKIDRDMIFPVKSTWTAWVVKYNPGVRNSGVEHLTIQFRNSGRYQCHHCDRGYNAIELAGATNSWVRNVKIQHADNGIFISRSEFITVQDCVVDSRDRTVDDGKDLNGHHAFSADMNGQDTLFKRCYVQKRYYHDFTTAQGQKLAVFSDVGGLDLNLDHHRGGPFANLFTNVDLGLGTRPFASGGRKDRGAYTGRGATLWNMRLAKASAPVKLPACSFGPYMNFVLPRPNKSKAVCVAEGWLVQKWAAPLPVDLYQAQLALRTQLAKRRAG